jgi:hypothetical protein
MIVSSFQVEEVGCYQDETTGCGTLKTEINEELEKCKNSVYVDVIMNLYFIEDKRKG